MLDSASVYSYAATMPALDEKEFVRLLEKHGGIIRKVAAGYASSHADRSDLMQEIALQLWKAYPRYSPERPFSTWMYRVALNVAISFLRRNTRRQTLPLDEIGHELVHDPAHDPEMEERIVLLQQVIARREPLERALLLLYLDDHSYREIGTILGLSETNVATKLNRLKQQLRQELTKPE